MAGFDGRESSAAQVLFTFLRTSVKWLVHVASLQYWRLASFVQHLVRLARTRPHDLQLFLVAFVRRNVLTLSNVLILLWVYTLYWGEVSLFDRHVEACDWRSWERWPAHAAPYHIAFVADPQLVDPHTYPDRPWPLSTLTIKHTDVYLRRSFSRIQGDLDPQSVLFLGDLFDGGREWSTRNSVSPEERYRKYGDDYWSREFERFSRIFFKEHSTGRRPERHIIASLPGNHDLGFADGVQLPVRERFNAFFGQSNRIDILANHTFVSIDTVSLSAKDTPNAEGMRNIWEPAAGFLEHASEAKSRAMTRYLRHLDEEEDPSYLHKHTSQDILPTDPHPYPKPAKFAAASADFPTILLTHVPLYRAPGTPCGPLREKYPPTAIPLGQTEPLFPDPRNALLVAGGYQYQNVLTSTISKEIVDAFNSTISRAFSGDDHDYCEVLHRGYSSPGSGIREITVKSISWAMGVRHPGFVLASLWNPVDRDGHRILAHGEDEDTPTMQTHLCLLPDQLSIFIRYGLLVGFSVVVLFVRAVFVTALPSVFGATRLPDLFEASQESLLPIHKSLADLKKRAPSPAPPAANGMTAGVSTSSTDSSLSSRPGRYNRSRPISPAPVDHGGYGVGDVPSAPLIAHARNRSTESTGLWKKTDDFQKITRPRRERGRVETLFVEWLSSIGWVAAASVAYYMWLLKK